MGTSWNLGLRWIPDIPVERAELRMTATTQVAPGLFVGLEFNPLDDDLGILANWRVWDEKSDRPALIVGTSSDRIGTPDGRAYYATLSKDLTKATGWPIAPYVGTAYGDFEDKWVWIGGVSARLGDRFQSTHTWDGHNLHHQIDHKVAEGKRVGLVVAEQSGKHYVGLSLGLSL